MQWPSEVKRETDHVSPKMDRRVHTGWQPDACFHIFKPVKAHIKLHLWHFCISASTGTSVIGGGVCCTLYWHQTFSTNSRDVRHIRERGENTFPWREEGWFSKESSSEERDMHNSERCRSMVWKMPAWEKNFTRKINSFQGHWQHNVNMLQFDWWKLYTCTQILYQFH